MDRITITILIPRNPLKEYHMRKTEVVCDTCGKTVFKETGEYNRRIRLGKDKFYCGSSCASKDPQRLSLLRQNTPNYDISKHSNNRKDQLSDFRWYIKAIKNRYNKEVDIDLDYLKDLWESQKGTCPFTGQQMLLRTHVNCRNKLTPYHASLDRIDCSKGYIKGNLRFVSVMANFARNNFSDEDLIEFCKKVAINH